MVGQSAMPRARLGAWWAALKKSHWISSLLIPLHQKIPLSSLPPMMQAGTIAHSALDSAASIYRGFLVNNSLSILWDPNPGCGGGSMGPQDFPIQGKK